MNVSPQRVTYHNAWAFFLKLLTYRRNWRSYRSFGTIDEKNSWRIWKLSENKTHSRENLVSQQLQRETVAVLELVNVMESTHAFLTGSFIHSWNIFVIFPRHDLTPASQLASRRIVLRNLEKKNEQNTLHLGCVSSTGSLV